VTNASWSSNAVLWLTEKCRLSMGGSQVEWRFVVAAEPSYLRWDCDGAIGWAQLQGNLMQIDAPANKLRFLRRLPAKARRWVQVGIVTNSDVLVLSVPCGTASTNATLVLDTGDASGVNVPLQRWKTWKAAHPHQPMTLRTFGTFDGDIVVEEEMWADQFSLGPLTLAGLPVSEDLTRFGASFGPQNEAVVGLAALRRLDLIVDWPHGVAYVEPKRTTPPAYRQNRLGASFVPPTPQSDELVASVVDGSPAQEAGVRNGDVLLSINGVDFTRWRERRLTGGGGPFEAAPGTKVTLTLKRDGKVFKAVAILRQILGPSSERHGTGAAAVPPPCLACR
jgi:hypothetical protein